MTADLKNAALPAPSADVSDMSEAEDIVGFIEEPDVAGHRRMADHSDCSDDEEEHSTATRSSLKADGAELRSAGQTRPTARPSLHRRMEALVKLTEKPPVAPPPASSADVSQRLTQVLTHEAGLESMREILSKCAFGDLNVLVALQPCFNPEIHWTIRRTALEAFKTISPRGYDYALRLAMFYIHDAIHEVREIAIEVLAAVAWPANAEVTELLTRMQCDGSQTFPVQMAAEEALLTLAELPLEAEAEEAPVHVQDADNGHNQNGFVEIELTAEEPFVPVCVDPMPCAEEIAPSSLHDIFQSTSTISCTEVITSTEGPVTKFGWFPDRPREADSEDEEERRDVALTRAALKSMTPAQWTIDAPATVAFAPACRTVDAPSTVAAEDPGEWIMA